MSASRPRWDIPERWQPALEIARSGGTLLLIGATDSGKSTLAAILAREARGAGRSAAVVDADIGQSSVGPPACVSLGRPDGDELRAAALDFVGACSPIGHLLQCAAAAAAMVVAARRAGDETLIVDTTGLIAGSAARALKAAKVRLTDPDVIIALQAEDEVSHLVAPYAGRERPNVLRLPISRAVRARSREDRAARRQRRFAQYFAGASAVEVSWDDAPVENSPWSNGRPAPGHIRAYAEERLGAEVLHAERSADGLLVIVSGRADPRGLRRLAEGFGGGARAIEADALDHLLVGLVGARGETLGLGILEEVDFAGRRLHLWTPLSDGCQVRAVRLGSVRIARDGFQLGTNEPGAVG